MMGIINNLLLQFVEESTGAQGRAAVLEKAGMPGMEFKAEQMYPEEQWQKLVGSALEHMGVDSETGQKAFAEWTLPVLVKSFRPFFDNAESAQAFLEKVPRIHEDFPSSSASSYVAKLTVKESGATRLVYSYASPNRLMPFLEALAHAVASHYGESIQVQSRSTGDDAWEVEIQFATGTPAR